MFGFLPSNLFTSYKGVSTSGLSPRVWEAITGTMQSCDGGNRLVLIGDDFMAAKPQSTSTVLISEAGGYTGYVETGGSVAMIGKYPNITNGQFANNTPVTGGVIALNHPGTAEDGMYLEAGDGTGGLFALDYPGDTSITATGSYLTVFEVAFMLDTVTDDVNAIFLGLANPGAAVTGALTSGSGIPNNTYMTNFIGFSVIHKNSGTVGSNSYLSFCYQASGQTIQVPICNVQTNPSVTISGGNTTNTTLGAAAGNAFAPLLPGYWYKAGFVLRTNVNNTSKLLAVYVNNIEQTSYGYYNGASIAAGGAGPNAYTAMTPTVTSPPSSQPGFVGLGDMKLATFPSNVPLTFFAALRGGSASTAGNLFIDWWAAGQLAV